MFGAGLIVPVPDIDRTDYLLDARRQPVRVQRQPGHRARTGPGGIEALRARGGRLVVVDPRRSRTAEEADEWSRRSARAPTRLLLAAMVTHAVRRGPRRPRRRSRQYVDRASTRSLAPCARSPPRRCADHRRRRGRRSAGSPASSPRRRRRASTAASAPPPPSSARSRSWLVDVLNVCTGNLDRPGGAMFTRAAAGASNTRGAPRSAGASASAAATAGCGACPSRSASCRPSAWPRRSTRRARARSGRSSPSPATRSLSTPNGDRLDAALGRRSTSWSRSTSTSTRPPGTPT